jgi:hypothetical protein
MLTPGTASQDPRSARDIPSSKAPAPSINLQPDHQVRREDCAGEGPGAAAVEFRGEIATPSILLR